MGTKLMDGNTNIEGVLIVPLKIISIDGGDVLHAMKSSDEGYLGFWEAYFSTIKHGVVKAWKRHREMVLNLIVPVGMITFVLYDDRQDSSTYGSFQEIILSQENYCRLTVPPMVWLGFKGVMEGANSMLLNIANIPHDPDEVDRLELDVLKYNWKLI